MLNGTPSCTSVSFLDSYNLDVGGVVKRWKEMTRLGKEREQKEGREGSMSRHHFLSIIGTLKIVWAGLAALKNKLRHFIKRYSYERPLREDHVRVRWKCVRVVTSPMTSPLQS